MKLNDLQIDKLQILLNDDVLLETIHQIFDTTVEANRPYVEKESDVVIGQKYRAYDTAKQLVADGFNAMEAFRKGEGENPKPNRAR